MLTDCDRLGYQGASKPATRERTYVNGIDAVGLSELLSHLAMKNGGASKKDGNDLRQDVARAVPILRDALAAWDAPCTFKRGDVLKVAPHSGIWKKDMGHVIVVRTHERHDAVVDSPMDLVKSCDMRVLITHDDGSVHEFAAHSRDFVLVETAEEHMP